MRRLGLTLLLFLPLDATIGQSASLPTASPASGHVKVFASFDSVTGDPTMSYKDHPDMTLAACSACGSAGQVMVATGPAVAVYDASGRLLKTQTTENFVRSSGIDFDAWKSKPAVPARAAGKVNDPRVTYDPFINRWIVVCSCSGAYLMVSGGKDSTGTWKGVVVDDEAGDLTMFPGWDRNGVYISKFQQKLNSRILALPSSDVAWRGKKNISLAHEATFDQQPYEMRPAIDPNPKKKLTDPEYLVARSGPPVTATNLPMDLLIDKIAWSGRAATISSNTTVSTGFFYNTPIAVSQLSGSPLRGDESHRVFSVVAYRDHLHVIEGSGPCTSNCGPQSQDANNLFYWFDIDTRTMTFSQKTKVSDPTLSLLFPSMALDSNGNAGVGMTGMSISLHPSIYLFTSRVANGTGKLDGPFLMHGGTEAYSCDKSPNGKVSWGTHSSTVQDGSNPKKLWTIQEYAGSPTPCVWKTRVIGFEIQEPKEARKGSAATSREKHEGWPFSAKEAERRQARTAKSLAVAKEVTVELGNGIPLKLTLIPPGKFMMGSPETETINLQTPSTHRANESPLHEVTINHPFFISVFKVTQEQYEQIMGMNPSKFVGKDYPVDSVTWDDAVLFCKKASAITQRNVHLPTEAQWEYAVRAGTATRYSFGDDETKIGDYAWFHDNAKGKTYPVGQKLPNAWGLFDVHGLLWEYTSDFYSESYANAQSNHPLGPDSGIAHSTRGGTYGSKAPFLRSAVRIESPAADATKDILSHFGFRVVVELASAP